MEKGFLPYSDGFGNFWGSERDEYRNATAPQVNFLTKPLGYAPNLTSVYPKKVQGFFANASGTLKMPTQIFYEYNGFLPTANNTSSRCSQNYNSFIQIQQDISSISQDPFSMAARLLTVRGMMNTFYMDCSAANAPSPPLPDELAEESNETPPPSPPSPPLPDELAEESNETPPPSWSIAPPIGMGGSPLLEGDLSLYCSQVPDDPVCSGEVVSSGIGSGKEKNWLLIGGIAVAAYFGYKYFVKK